MRILYFAWLRQKIGRSEDELDLPASVETAGQLVAMLAARGEGYAAAFSNDVRIRIAINQVHAGSTSRVTNSDEVAFFPPVTGG